MKLYSDILKGKEMDHTEIPMETVQGISVAFGYGLDLLPGPAIEPDGNCVIELVMDQMKRYVYWSALATAPAETSAQAKEAFNFTKISSSFH